MFESIKYKIEDFLNSIKLRIFHLRMKRKYPDYKDDEYNWRDLKFIWGVRSCDDFSSLCPANFYTMNDIDICYDRKTDEYMLGIETIYWFKDGRKGQIEYYNRLLDSFTEFMVDEGYDIEPKNSEFLTYDPHFPMKSDSIETLYDYFRIFVKGFEAVYGDINVSP